MGINGVSQSTAFGPSKYSFVGGPSHSVSSKLCPLSFIKEDHAVYWPSAYKDRERFSAP